MEIDRHGQPIDIDWRCRCGHWATDHDEVGFCAEDGCECPGYKHEGRQTPHAERMRQQACHSCGARPGEACLDEERPHYPETTDGGAL